MQHSRLLEIACFDLRSSQISEQNGADRIELCQDYPAGGITPSRSMIVSARQTLKIPLHVIIRPRSGNFIYTVDEFKIMKEDIVFCRENGVDGIVTGILNNQRGIDEERVVELISLSAHMPVTFHRAIDECKNLDSAFERLISLGVQRVLTTGGAGSAEQGISALSGLQRLYGNKIMIMPGGGLRSENLLSVMTTNCTEYHSSAIRDNGFIADASEIATLRRILDTGLTSSTKFS